MCLKELTDTRAKKVQLPIKSLHISILLGYIISTRGERWQKKFKMNGEDPKTFAFDEPLF